MEIISFFDKYEKVIVGIGGIATALALVVGCLALWFTWAQIREAKLQLRAGISYNMHKDGREIFKALDNEVVDFIRSLDPTREYSDELRKKAESKIHEILMYYASVYHQWLFGNIHDREWKVISAEFCTFLKHPHVKEYWEKSISKNTLWNEGFRKKGDECLGKEKGG